KFITTVILYDEKGRTIQTQTGQINGIVNVATTQYDYSGKVLKSHVKHTKWPKETKLLTVNEYDHAGRLVTVKKRVMDHDLKIVSQLSYDELGALKQKQLGQQPANGTEPLEKLDYTYNIRGW